MTSIGVYAVIFILIGQISSVSPYIQGKNKKPRTSFCRIAKQIPNINTKVNQNFDVRQTDNPYDGIALQSGLKWHLRKAL